MTPRARRQRGFTLIELVIAIAVVAVLLGGAVMSIGALTGAQAKEATTRLAGTIRSMYDTANLTGKTCRMVFELPEPKDDAGQVKYRAECAEGGVTAGRDRDAELKLVNDDAKELKAKKRPKADPNDSRFQALNREGAPSVQELMLREKERVESAAKFSGYTSEEVAVVSLPRAVRLDVWTRKQRDPVKSGLAYLYFFPQAYTERAQIWVRQGKNTWTLKVAPLTGKTSVVADDLEVPKT